MKHVAKLVIIDGSGDYLLLHRSEHPLFGNDPDLPGGTQDDEEKPLQTMLRELYEEVGVTISALDATCAYEGTDYSTDGTQYSLYICQLKQKPRVTLSWEHTSYEWLQREDFLQKSQAANDTFMHMVYDVLSEHSNV